MQRYVNCAGVAVALRSEGKKHSDPGRQSQGKKRTYSSGVTFMCVAVGTVSVAWQQRQQRSRFKKNITAFWACLVRCTAFVILNMRLSTLLVSAMTITSTTTCAFVRSLPRLPGKMPKWLFGSGQRTAVRSLASRTRLSPEPPIRRTSVLLAWKKDTYACV